MSVSETAIVRLEWSDLIARSLGGQGITREEARAILNVPDAQILEALLAAY